MLCFPHSMTHRLCVQSHSMAYALCVCQYVNRNSNKHISESRLLDCCRFIVGIKKTLNYTQCRSCFLLSNYYKSIKVRFAYGPSTPPSHLLITFYRLALNDSSDSEKHTRAKIKNIIRVSWGVEHLMFFTVSKLIWLLWNMQKQLQQGFFSLSRSLSLALSLWCFGVFGGAMQL